MKNLIDWTEWILQKNNEAKTEASKSLIKTTPVSQENSKIPVQGTPLHFQHHEDLPGKFKKSRYGVYHGDNLIGEVDTNGDHSTSTEPPKEYEDHYRSAENAIFNHHISKHGSPV